MRGKIFNRSCTVKVCKPSMSTIALLHSSSIQHGSVDHPGQTLERAARKFCLLCKSYSKIRGKLRTRYTVHTQVKMKRFGSNPGSGTVTDTVLANRFRRNFGRLVALCIASVFRRSSWGSPIQFEMQLQVSALPRTDIINLLAALFHNEMQRPHDAAMER